MTDDVVVVGGRCAGAPLAMLLARALSDVVSGHMVKSAGVARLHAWGLYDAVLATGAPPLREITLWLEGHPQSMPTPPPGPSRRGCRRSPFADRPRGGRGLLCVPGSGDLRL